MIRWPDKIATGKVADETFADLDRYPTIAHLIGEEKQIAKDRPIAANQANFLLGKHEKSGREHVITYTGDRVFAVKWRNMEVPFASSEGTHLRVRLFNCLINTSQTILTGKGVSCCGTP